MGPKVSVIIPVYNAEKYVEKCIMSVLKQSFNSFEIVIVNDGSTDGSGTICERIAKIYKRVSYYHKENGGVSSARNHALRYAKGEFITFIDADDHISKEYLKELIKAQNETEADWTACSYRNINNARSAYRVNVTEWDKDVYTCGSRIKELLASKVLACPSGKRTLASPTCKLYRRSIIMDNDLRFDEKLMTCEDQMFNLRYVQYIRSFKYIHKYLYYRNVNDGSLFTGFRPNMLEEYTYLFNCYEHIVSELGFVPITQHQFILEKIIECLRLYVFHSDNKENRKKVNKNFWEFMESDPLKGMWEKVNFMMYRGKRNKIIVIILKSKALYIMPYVM